MAVDGYHHLHGDNSDYESGQSYHQQQPEEMIKVDDSIELFSEDEAAVNSLPRRTNIDILDRFIALAYDIGYGNTPHLPDSARIVLEHCRRLCRGDYSVEIQTMLIICLAKAHRIIGDTQSKQDPLLNFISFLQGRIDRMSFEALENVVCSYLKRVTSRFESGVIRWKTLVFLRKLAERVGLKRRSPCRCDELEGPPMCSKPDECYGTTHKYVILRENRPEVRNAEEIKPLIYRDFIYSALVEAPGHTLTVEGIVKWVHKKTDHNFPFESIRQSLYGSQANQKDGWWTLDSQAIKSVLSATKYSKLWSIEDDDLLTVYRSHGHSWDKISAMIPGRSNHACKTRYHRIREKHSGEPN